MNPYVEDRDLPLYCGDALEVLRKMSADSVDAIVTSPPYGDARDDDYPCPSPDEFAGWILPILVELKRVLTPSGGFMLNLGRIFRGGLEHPYIDETIAAAKTVGWVRIDTLIWHKPNGRGNQHDRLCDQHEYVFWLARYPSAYRGFDSETRRPYSPASLARYQRPFKSAAKHRPREEAGRIPHPDGAKPSSVFSCTVGQEKGNDHPAPMATKLARHLIALSCPRGGTVLDPFAGSGTTGAAARQLGRRSILVEISAEYCRMAAERLQQLSLLAEVAT